MDLNQEDPQALLKEFLAEESGAHQEESAENPSQEAEGSDEVEVEGSGEVASQDQQDNPAEQAATNQAEDDEEAEGVASKNGKHVIPYSVLKNERERAARAERIAQEADARARDFEARLTAASQGAKPGESARTSQEGPALDLSSDELESLKEDFPTVYKAVMASKAVAEALETKLKPVEERAKASEVERERADREAVQEAIDSIPKLAFLQSGNQEAFELARQFDAQLSGIPAWSGKPLNERFERVVEMVESAIGAIELPGKTPTKTTPSLSAEQLAKAAKAKAAESAKKSGSAVPTSLSEFPAGLAPAVDEQEMLENLSPVELGRRMAGMTPEQLDAYLSQ